MISLTDPGNPAPRMAPENVLYRSRAEIGRILQELASKDDQICAELGDNKQFLAHLLAVDPAAGYFVIAYGANKLLNSALFARSSTEFTANYQNAHLAFQVGSPSSSLFEGQPAIRFALPKAIIVYHHRERPHIPSPADISLRCIADEGGILPFEARITDVTPDGMAAMLYDQDINIEAGTILKSSRIVIPNGKAVIADFEVCYTTTVSLADGMPANRAVLRFTQRPDEIGALTEMFAENRNGATLRRQ